jgi:hypothetical protein
MSRRLAAVQTVDRIDYWIRRHVIQHCHETHPAQSKLNPARDRRVWLSAIGQTESQEPVRRFSGPNPPHLAALVKQLEMQEQR